MDFLFKKYNMSGIVNSIMLFSSA